MPKVQLKDVGIYYEIYGKGAPVILIGGLGSDIASWGGVVKVFSTYFQVIVFDNRGCGRSDIGHNTYTINTMAEDAVNLMGYLEIRRAHIIGHSMGGCIALELAINHPERLDKLVLSNTTPVFSERNNALFEEMYNQLFKEGPSEDWFRKWTLWLFSPETLKNAKFIETFIRESVKYPYLQTAEGFKSQIDAIKQFDVRDKLNLIKAKALILEGKDDVLITPEEAETLAKGISGSIFRLLDGVAHSIHMENPKLFTDNVLEFLDYGK